MDEKQKEPKNEYVAKTWEEPAISRQDREFRRAKQSGRSAIIFLEDIPSEKTTEEETES